MLAKKGAKKWQKWSSFYPFKNFEIHHLDFFFRHFYEKLDGPANGPIGPNGPIGQKIRALNDNLTPIVDFVPISTNIPDFPDDLLKDQHDLQMVKDLCKGIDRGQIDPKYETKERITIGKHIFQN